MTAKKAKKTENVASATTARTGQVGAAETKVTPVEHEKDAAKAESRRAPGREGHAVGVPRKTMAEKFGPKNPDLTETRVRMAAVGGI